MNNFFLPNLYTVGTGSIQTPLNFLHLDIISSFELCNLWLSWFGKRCCLLLFCTGTLFLWKFMSILVTLWISQFLWIWIFLKGQRTFFLYSMCTESSIQNIKVTVVLLSSLEPSAGIFFIFSIAIICSLKILNIFLSAPSVSTCFFFSY